MCADQSQVGHLYRQYLFIKSVQDTLGRTKKLPSAAHFVGSGNVTRALTHLSLRWIDIRRAGDGRGFKRLHSVAFTLLPVTHTITTHQLKQNKAQKET